MTISIIIPARNEALRIRHTLDRLVMYCASHKDIIEVLVVLNNCTDNTETIVNEYIAQLPIIRIIDCGVIIHKGSGTKGFAVERGLQESVGDYALFMDADNATDVSELDKLLPYAYEGIPVVIGSRYVQGATITKRQSRLRFIAGRMGNLLIQACVLPDVHDTQCGFKLLSRPAIEAIVPKLTVYGWGFDIELLAYARKLKIPIQEVGIVWHDVSRSMVRLSAFIHVLGELWDIFVRVRLGSRFSDSNSSKVLTDI